LFFSLRGKCCFCCFFRCHVPEVKWVTFAHGEKKSTTGMYVDCLLYAVCEEKLSYKPSSLEFILLTLFAGWEEGRLRGTMNR
jgi:hypothetical protein